MNISELIVTLLNKVERVINDDFLGGKINEKCPKCGADLLGNKMGDKWCSMVGCDYGLRDE